MAGITGGWMNIAIVSFTDVDSGIDLANALAACGKRVTLYLSRKHVRASVGKAIRLREFLH